MRDGLKAIGADYPNLVEDVRGKGFLIGAKLRAPNIKVRDAARAERLLLGVAGDNTIRLAPALNVTPAEIEECLARLRSALDAVASDRKHAETASAV